MPVNSSSNGTTAVTVQTGVQRPFLYEAVAKKNCVVVGGAANTVAVAGGFVGGGGHSPLSTYYVLQPTMPFSLQLRLATEIS